MVLEDVTEQHDDFIRNFEQDLIKFRDHHNKVINQYEHISLLKERLPQDHVTVQIDSQKFTFATTRMRQPISRR